MISVTAFMAKIHLVSRADNRKRDWPCLLWQQQVDKDTIDESVVEYLDNLIDYEDFSDGNDVFGEDNLLTKVKDT